MSVKTIVITGASSGIGKATAKFFAEKGWNVAATMRNPEKETEFVQSEQVKLYKLDVTDQESIQKAKEAILNDFGKVDALLNNAGYGLMGALEHATTEQIRYQFDVNVFGLIDVTRAFLPHFRENREGVILNVSSVGGRVAFPFISLYHSTKWAVEGLTESLSYELGELNIRAKIIEPGAINTDFGGRSMVFAQSDSIRDYDEALAQMTNAMSELATNQASEPELVAEVIYEAATDGKNQLRYRAGADCEEWLNQREAAGDDQFIATIKQQIFGS